MLALYSLLWDIENEGKYNGWKHIVCEQMVLSNNLQAQPVDMWQTDGLVIY